LVLGFSYSYISIFILHFKNKKKFQTKNKQRLIGEMFALTNEN